MVRSLKKSIQVMVFLLLMFVTIWSFSIPAFAATVTISQSGNVITATNSIITVTYDLSTGKGVFKAGSTTLISDFYSDYKLFGISTRINSYDAATRTASWVSIGTDGYGTNGQKLTITNSLSSGSTIVLNIAMYENQSYIIVDMTVNNGTSQTLEIIEPISANNLDIGSGTDKRIYTTPTNNNYDFGVAPVNNFGNSENGYDRKSGDTLTWSAFNGISHWVAAMFDNTSKQGVIGGAATTVNWRSDQSLKAASSANGPLTGFSIYNTGGTQSGTSVSSDKFFLGYFSDFRTGLETFADAYTVAQPKLAWTGAVPIGFNSWYAFYSFGTADSMYSMTDYFFNNLKVLGYNYINLDACYKGVPGQTQNQNWQAFVNYVHSKNMKAGTYSTPFAIWDPMTATVPGTSYTFNDIALKDSTGTPIYSYINSYIVDATHPGGQTYIQSQMDNFANLGFDYVKLDFIDLGMYEGTHYDSTKNGMQAYRIGMQLIKTRLLAAVQSIYINESIAPLFPSGYAHGRRSGVDSTIALQSYPGYERQAFNTAASWWTNRKLYEYNDPDMFLPENIANGYSKWTLNAGTLLSTAAALGGGHWLAGDNVPFLAEDRMALMKNTGILDLVTKGAAAKPVKMTNYYHLLEHSPAVTYLTDTNGDRIVGLSNWNMTAYSTVSFNFSDLGLGSGPYTLTELYSNTLLGQFTTSYSKNLRPGESMIVRVSANSSTLPTPPPNLAAGKTATASSTQAGGSYAASKVTDGSYTTFWRAAPAQTLNQWIEVDLGSSTNINRVIVSEYDPYLNGSFAVETYTLQYWNGSSYVNLTKGYTLKDRRVFDFPTVSTTKIRLFLTKSRANPGIYEIEAYNITGNTGFIIDQDDTNATYSSTSDIYASKQRMQTFSITQSSLSKMDVYIYESYVSKVPEDLLYFDIWLLDVNNNPTTKLFSASLTPYNIPGAAVPYSIYPRLTGLDTTKKYGLILRSPLTIDDGSTNNKYGFAYNDSNPYAGGFERVSTDGGVSWTTESSRDLIFTIYK